MRVIIAGSRNIKEIKIVEDAIRESGFKIDVVISGTAYGVDKLGEKWATLNEKKIERYPADWEKHGRSAGPIRNAKMAEVADALIAIWDGSSKGTQNMINTAKKKNLKVFVKNMGV